MPSTYAHYRFGTAMLSTMPGDVRRTIQRFRQLFDVGLHGPDIFYYSSPVLKKNTGFLGIRYHEQPGHQFFQRVCRVVRLDRSEAAQAYLYGVLCHYCLDWCCQTFLAEQAKLCGISPLEIETEFDRFLLEKDGKVPPSSQDLSPHLRLTPGECETAAKFYPPATAGNVKDSLRNMALFTRLLATPEGPRRTVLQKSMGLVAKELKGMWMTPGPNPRCAQLDTLLLERYEAAVARFPEMLSQLQAHMTYNAPFEKTFG